MILWLKYWVKVGFECVVFIGDEFEVNWDEYLFLIDEFFYFYSFKLNK